MTTNNTLWRATLGNIKVTTIEILSSNNAKYGKWVVRIGNKSMKTDKAMLTMWLKKIMYKCK